MADKITTLHPENDTSINLYPNVKDENIPNTIARVSYVDEGDNENNLAISAVRADLDTEIGDRKKDTADTNGRIDGLATDISFLETRITGLHDAVTGVNNELQEEITNRENADTALEENILDLYRMVIRSGDTITVTDASVALSSQPFPLTVSPKALLDYVGGMCKKCENVLGLEKLTNNVIDGITITTDGSVITMSGSITKGVFYQIALSTPLEAGTYYCSWNASGTTAESITFRKSDGANLGNLWNGGSVTLTEKAYYICLHFTDTEKTYNGTFKLMVSHGSAPKAYEPFFEGIKTAPVTAVKVYSRNGLLAKGDIVTEVLVGDKTKLNGTNILPNFTSYASGQESGVYCEKNSWIVDKISNLGECAVPLLANYFLKTNCVVKFNREITLNNGVNDNIYEASVSTLPIPAEVKALDGYGWGINADCYNYIDFENKKFVKKVAKVDLGTLTWNIATGGFDAALSGAITGKGTAVDNILCSKYQAITGNQQYNASATGICLGGNGIGSSGHVRVSDSSYTSAESFKTAMSGVYLYYELATPVETDISQYLDRDLPDNDVIDVTAGGHLEFENENNAGVPYSVTYQSKPETQGE